MKKLSELISHTMGRVLKVSTLISLIYWLFGFLGSKILEQLFPQTFFSEVPRKLVSLINNDYVIGAMSVMLIIAALRYGPLIAKLIYRNLSSIYSILHKKISWKHNLNMTIYEINEKLYYLDRYRSLISHSNQIKNNEDRLRSMIRATVDSPERLEMKRLSILLGEYNFEIDNFIDSVPNEIDVTGIRELQINKKNLLAGNVRPEIDVSGIEDAELANKIKLFFVVSRKFSGMRGRVVSEVGVRARAPIAKIP